jgi:nitroreductase
MPMPSAMASREPVMRAGWPSMRSAAVGLVEAVQDGHQRALAGAVLADDAVHRAGGHGQVTSRLACTAPKRLWMRIIHRHGGGWRPSSGARSVLAAVGGHVVDDLDLAADDVGLGGVDLLLHVGVTSLALCSSSA